VIALHYAKAVEAMKAGDTLAVHNPNPMKPDDVTRYFLVARGENVTAVAFRKMYPSLRPVADGLFGAEMPQTYEWAGS
jgi:hypothetical protein